MGKTYGDEVIGVHCSAHKLELAYKDACTDVKLYTLISATMANLYLRMEEQKLLPMVYTIECAVLTF